MVKIQERIEIDLRLALKEQAQMRLDVLRLLKSDLQYEMSKTGAKELSDDQVQKIIGRGVKRRRESIDQYQKGGRSDLVDKEQQELSILEKYLPPPIPDSELNEIIAVACDKIKPQGSQDIGKIIGIVIGQLKGRQVDGNRVRQIVTEKLQVV